MDIHVLVCLLVTAVLSDGVKITSSEEDCTLHFHLNDDSGANMSTDVVDTDEISLFVNV